MKLVLAIVLMVASVALVQAEDSNVVVLSPDNFDEVIGENKQTLVEFYAPWCGHCKALTPEYEDAANQLVGKDAGALAKVDCTEHRDLCGKYEVRGFPTLKLFRNDGSDPSDYDQARKADAIVRFMVKQNQPAVTELADSAAVDAFAEGESVVVVAFAKSGTSLDAFTDVAKSMRNEFSFGVTRDADAAKKAGVTAPAVVVKRDFDEGDVTFAGDIDSEEDLRKFIVAQSFPTVGEIGPENYAKYVDRGLNFLWVFVDPKNDDHTALLSGAVKSVASDHKSDLSFVWLDGVKWAEHAKSFGLSGNTPAVVIEDRQKRKNFVLDESKDIDEASIRAHVEGYLAGSLSPTVKSEPVPESNDGPVTVIVGKTFDEIVLDDSKDVLVEFYAPWCGHCKNLAPKYEELGEMFKDDSNVVIAKIDSTANDSPAEVQGFPTLIFYPAGDKSNTKHYNGDRTAEAMAKFIEDNRQSSKGSKKHEEL